MIDTTKTSVPSPSPDLESQTDMLLRLLTQVILADGHIFPSEIEALNRGANQLGLTDKLGIPLAEVAIQNWFESYKMELNTETSPLPKDVALTHLILKLSDLPNKKAVVDVLTEISLADDNFHIEEKTLISIVQAFWQYEGLDAPNAKIET